MNNVYNPEYRGNKPHLDPVVGGVLPDWAQNREPDYPKLELDNSAPYRIATIGVPRLAKGYQVILQICASHADMWERVP